MSILQSFVFGVTLAVSLGPIALLIVSYGLTVGRRVAVLSGLGAALADLTYALAGFSVGYTLVTLLQEYRAVFTVLSSCLLVGMGLYIVWGAVRKRAVQEHPAHRAGPAAALWTTYGLTIMNPLTIMLFLAFAGHLPAMQPADILVHATAVFAGSLLVQSILALAGAFLGAYLTGSSIRLLNMLSGAGIVLFGLSRMIW